MHRVDQRLHDRVICRIQMVSEFGGTVSGTIIRFVGGRRDNPIVPADSFEVHPQLVSAALIAVALSALGLRDTAASFSPLQLAPVGEGRLPRLRVLRVQEQ